MIIKTKLYICLKLLIICAAFASGVETNSVSVAKSEGQEGDLAARRFVLTCSGCHSLSGVKLTGPELSHTASWPSDQLKQAITRMQERVGPLKEEEINALVSLLHDPQVRERLKKEEGRIAEQLMAKLEPPNYTTGKELFEGKRGLRNGGLACIGCHAINGVGGKVGPDLGGVTSKMAEPALASAIEKSAFMIMGPHYKAHPIELQEAVHIARYLAEEGKRQNRGSVVGAGTFVNVGAALAGIVYVAAVGLLVRSRRKNRNRKIGER